MYLAYVKTPYYKFARDTLSYLLLVGLHFFLCLEPATREMKVIEWIIFTFFIGRYLVERKQIRQQKATYFRFVFRVVAVFFFSHKSCSELLKKTSTLTTNHVKLLDMIAKFQNLLENLEIYFKCTRKKMGIVNTYFYF